MICVCVLSSVAAVDLEKSCEVQTSVENPTVNNAGICPWQNKRRSLQLETGAAEEEPRELCECASLQMKQLLGHGRGERGNTVDRKRKMQEYQLTMKGWANFHCRVFFSLFIPLFSSLFSSDVLVVRLSLS